MWQCEWEQVKRDDETVRNIVDAFELVPRLQPRDAFFGGRTNAVKLYHVAQEGEKIYYYDFPSLYPWTNKNCLYPVGHPRILYEPGSTDIAPYFGLVKCKILPPYHLYHPVLPHRSGGKLTFPLCRTCVKEEQPKPLPNAVIVVSTPKKNVVSLAPGPPPNCKKPSIEGTSSNTCTKYGIFPPIPTPCSPPTSTPFSR